MENGKATATQNLPAGAEWLVAIGAFIYTTGFLVELVHADYLGTPGIAMDLFRTKYLLVGVLCLALPVILTAAALGLSGVWAERDHRATEPDSGPSPLYGSSIVLVINLLLALYTYVLFAPLGYARDRPYAIFLIFAVTVAGILIIEFLRRFLKVNFAEPFRVGARWVLCAGIILVLDVHCFWGLADRLRNIFWPRGLNFVLLVSSMAFVLWRVAARETQYQSPRARHGLRILAWCVVGLLYVLAVFAF